jgi:hypothetical protein
MPTKVSSPFGPRDLFGRSKHDGVDYSTPMGSPIYNNKELRVVYSGSQNGYGNVVRAVDQQGTEYIFGHLDSIPDSTKVGTTLPPGSLIAHTGNSGDSTGPHLHYEIRQGKPAKSYDPLTTIDPTTGKPYESNASFEPNGTSLRNTTAKKDPNYTVRGKEKAPAPPTRGVAPDANQSAAEANRLNNKSPALNTRPPRNMVPRINPLLKLGNK